jgi:hypothetical protein
MASQEPTGHKTQEDQGDDNPHDRLLISATPTQHRFPNGLMQITVALAASPQNIFGLPVTVRGLTLILRIGRIEAGVPLVVAGLPSDVPEFLVKFV